MKVIEKPITRKKLLALASSQFGNMVKAVIDIEREIMVIDASLHSDQEALLLSEGSKQKNLWGINLYPELSGEAFIEFDSMINVRPHYGNKTRGVDSSAIRKKIRVIIAKLIV